MSTMQKPAIRKRKTKTQQKVYLWLGLHILHRVYVFRICLFAGLHSMDITAFRGSWK